MELFFTNFGGRGARRMETAIDYRLVFALMSGRVHMVLNRRLNKNFERAGVPLKVEQWDILLILQNRQIATQLQLGEATSMSKSTVNRLVNQLEEMRIVERFKSRVDWRSNYVRLTRRGIELCDKAGLVASKTLKDSLRGLSSTDISITQATLNAVMDNLLELDKTEQPNEISNLMKHVRLHKKMVRHHVNLRGLKKHNI